MATVGDFLSDLIATIKAYGRGMTLHRMTNEGTYSPVTGNITGEVFTPVSVTGLGPSPLIRKLGEDINYNPKDVVVWLPGDLANAPTEKDKLEIASVVYKIKEVQTHGIVDQVAAYRVVAECY